MTRKMQDGDEPQEEEFNHLAFAWSKGFMASVAVFVVTYEALIIALVSDRWRFYFEPLCIVLVYLLARWKNVRRRRPSS
jgi:hypothetical protein